jgi:DNA repair photolyase
MRWSEQLIEHEPRAALPGYRDEAVVRHFEAPDSVPTRFYEVRAKSILNRVPEASRMPFRWTINPFRGCTHACAYCLEPETPVLLADGRTRPIGELRAGELIYGTTTVGGPGAARCLTLTVVLDAWRTHRRAYRVCLADGRELVASSDHRLLTAGGWRHVAGGPGRQPLRVGEDVLVGLGAAADPGLVAAGFLARAERALIPGRSIEGRMVAAADEHRVVAIEALRGERELCDITTGTGDFIADGVVSHNCFARPTHTYLDFDAGRDFEREIVVKVNAPERLRAELARPSWRGEHIALGTNTDPYQWVEGRYGLMRGIWQAMIDARNPSSVLTKSPLLLRDLDLMSELSRRTEFSAALSVPTIDERAWRATEPHTPNPRTRLEAVARLTSAGIRTGVLVAPLMPGINDDPEQVREILRLCTEAGAAYVTGIALHLRGEVRQVFMEWLQDHRPDLVPRYRALYRRGAYAPVDERRRLAALLEAPGLSSSEWARGTRRDPPSPGPPARAPSQTRLFGD